VTQEPQLFHNMLTRDALLIHRGIAHSLEGPYASREEAERAAEELIRRLESEEADSENGDGV
jgi:hypothetical protein